MYHTTGLRSFEKNISTFLVRLFACLFCCAIAAIFLSGKGPVMWLLLLGNVLLLCVCIPWITRTGGSHFGAKLFAAAFLIRLAAVLVFPTEPVSDFHLMYHTAERLCREKLDLSSYRYFAQWAYQTGFVLYEALILKIFPSIWALKVMNCLFGSGITYLIYKICGFEPENQPAAKAASLLYAFFVFPVVHTPVLSNSHISAFFLFASLYFLLRASRGKPIRNVVISSVLLAIGNLMRPDGLILIVSFAVYFLFRILEDMTWRSVRKQLGYGLLFFLLYGCIMEGAGILIQLSGVNANGLQNNDPLWKFVLGFNTESGGWYAEQDAERIRQTMEALGTDRRQAELEIIRQRLRTPPGQMLELFRSKIHTIWWHTGGISWTFSGIENRKELEKLLCGVSLAQFRTVMACVVLGIPGWYRAAMKKKSAMLPAFILFCAFSVYLLIEVQPRYAYLPQIAVFILAGYGINVLKELLRSLTSATHKREKRMDYEK